MKQKEADDHIYKPVKQAQKHLNMDLDNPNALLDNIAENLVDISLRTDTETFTVRVCTECGETQSMNFPAWKKKFPVLAQEQLQARRRDQAEAYIETGERPVKDEVLKGRMERELLTWENSYCEQRHPAGGRGQ